jgi:hypothetical protein
VNHRKSVESRKLATCSLFVYKFFKVSDEKIGSLTKEEILDKINNKNVSQIFLKEKDFKAIVFSKIFLNISHKKKLAKDLSQTGVLN